MDEGIVELLLVVNLELIDYVLCSGDTIDLVIEVEVLPYEPRKQFRSY